MAERHNNHVQIHRFAAQQLSVKHDTQRSQRHHPPFKYEWGMLHFFAEIAIASILPAFAIGRNSQFAAQAGNTLKTGVQYVWNTDGPHAAGKPLKPFSWKSWSGSAETERKRQQ